MIYGAEPFLLAYATWGLEQWRPSPANRRAPGDPGPLRSPCCCGALRRTDCGFDCQGCGANLAIRDGVLIVRATPTGDNKIAADFYHTQLWPTVRFWERAFWILNGGERRARDVVLRRLPKSPGLRLLNVAIGGSIRVGSARTGLLSASISPRPCSPPAGAGTAAAICGSS
jgi:hypothetical protein